MRIGRISPAGAIVLALLSIGWSGERAEASGYALREQSASALGNAFAGATAGAEDLSYMFFNPAGLTRQSGSQIIGIGNVIIPRVKIHDARASTGGGVPIGGNAGGRDAAEDAFVPVFYGLLDLQQSLGTKENIKLGLGVNVPFGLETDYRDGWLGRYYALHSKILAVNVNPAIAWEVVDGVSVAAGLQVQYMQARLTNAIDFGSIGRAFGVPGAVPTQQDGVAKVDGNDIGYGFNLGVLYEPWAGTRVGAAYRSAIDQTLHGDGTVKLDNAGVGRALSAGGLFRDGGINGNVTTPETASFGIYRQLSPEWAVMGEAAWTRWSRFEGLTIKFDNPAQPNSVTDDDWEDTWFFALGATWRPNEAWTLRGGVALDQDPVPDSRRTPRIPTGDRYWLSFGAGYQPFTNIAIDFGYTHVFMQDASIDLSASRPGNQFRGNLAGRAEGEIDILALQVRWAF
jgi:long-chain fatty acid transport protein